MFIAIGRRIAPMPNRPQKTMVCPTLFIPSQRLPRIQAAEPIEKKGGARGPLRAGLLALVAAIESAPGAAQQLRRLPGVELQLLDLFGQFFQDRDGQPLAARGKTD